VSADKVIGQQSGQRARFVVEYEYPRDDPCARRQYEHRVCSLSNSGKPEDHAMETYMDAHAALWLTTMPLAALTDLLLIRS